MKEIKENNGLKWKQLNRKIKRPNWQWLSKKQEKLRPGRTRPLKDFQHSREVKMLLNKDTKRNNCQINWKLKIKFNKKLNKIKKSIKIKRMMEELQNTIRIILL